MFGTNSSSGSVTTVVSSYWKSFQELHFSWELLLRLPELATGRSSQCVSSNRNSFTQTKIWTHVTRVAVLSQSLAPVGMFQELRNSSTALRTVRTVRPSSVSAVSLSHSPPRLTSLFLFPPLLPS
eukprot:3487228-Rhodomonas_salina.1